jgi:prevent-host-death family protein
MRRVQVVEAKAHFSALLAAVESGESIAITRHGRVVARLVPDVSRAAAEIFSPIWMDSDEIDLVAPQDPVPEPVESL